MESHLKQAAGTWDSEAGAFVSEQHKTLATVLHDYKPSLSLVWIPPKDRTAEDTKPWAILDSPSHLPPHIIRYMSDAEMQNTQEVLSWVFEGDLTKHRPNDVLAKMEAREKAQRLLNLRQQEEELADQLDLIAFAARTPLHQFKHNGKTYGR